jgi:hypothetical protein
VRDQDEVVARLKQIVVDARRPAMLARFWVAALEGFEIRAYDADEVARLAAIGRTPETDPGVILDDPGVELCFQEAEVAEVAKKPLHLDIVSDDRSAEVDDLVVGGAEVVEVFDDHTWMRDPEGNDFCVVDG